ncbi:hypothetical protein RJ639_038940 [Escallonia herrerae]|uniref:DNA repair metallo-beta-lactamase domain-containing protein n=1 Tax=Escallonia herrerae TaxID=1293975 RepID=A0AA88WNH5_9ASTE|nr:hypothetical protein RJ639_038940 [Escallonia herrerae]
MKQVINCIWKHPGISVVYLTCDLLGQEEILVNVSQTFGSKIFVDKESNPDCFHALSLTVPEVLSQDSSCRFQIFDGFPKLYERAEAKLADARAKFQSEPLIIRPSAQWYACEEPSEARKRGQERFNEAVRDKFGVWHVCYSMHSSREELDWALQLLAPKRVASTTPSYWAMELDYVKKHCFKTQVASDDPLWKLLNIGVEAPLSADVSMEGCLPMILTSAEPESQALDASTYQNELFNPSPPSTSPVVTLFGRARLSNQDFTYLHEENEQLSNVYDSIHTEDKKVEDTTFEKDSDTEEECEKSLKKEKAVNSTEAKCKLVEMKSESCERASCSSIRPSKHYCENLRKMYRTMNVAVPQPLPSLVELMNANKQAKRKFTLY